MISRLYQESDHERADGLLPEATARFNWLMRIDETQRRRLLRRFVRNILTIWDINPNGGTHEIARDARMNVMQDFKSQAARDLLGAEQINALSVWLAGELRP